MSAQPTYEVVVLGAGVNGAATAAALASRGVQGVALLEQFSVGHTRGSSHGVSRITRSAYGDPAFVRLMQHVHREEWPRIERDSGRQLIHRNDGCFFGEGPLWDDYVSAVVSQGVDVELISNADATQRFPMFRFVDTASVLHDRTGGVVAAGDSVAALVELAVRRGATLVENCGVSRISLGGDPILLQTSQGTIAARRLVVTAGSWLGRLLPQFSAGLSVLRQTVGYFRLGGEPASLRIPNFPVWAWVGPTPNEFFYGLAEFQRPGVKVGRHRTSGAGDDADESPTIDATTLADLDAFIAKQFACPVATRVHAEHCLYTATADEDFLLDLLPGDPRVAIGSACSGHGFKFGPWTGEVLADLVLNGRSDREGFDDLRSRFAFPTAKE